MCHQLAHADLFFLFVSRSPWPWEREICRRKSEQPCFHAARQYFSRLRAHLKLEVPADSQPAVTFAVQVALRGFDLLDSIFPFRPHSLARTEAVVAAASNSQAP